MPPLYHQRHQHLGHAEQAKAGHSPPQLESFERRVIQRAVTDLSAEVIQHGIDRTDGLDLFNHVLQRAIIHRIQQMPAR